MRIIIVQKMKDGQPVFYAIVQGRFLRFFWRTARRTQPFSDYKLLLSYLTGIGATAERRMAGAKVTRQQRKAMAREMAQLMVGK